MRPATVPLRHLLQRLLLWRLSNLWTLRPLLWHHGVGELLLFPLSQVSVISSSVAAVFWLCMLWQAIASTLDGIIDTVSADHPLPDYLATLKLDGKLIMVCPVCPSFLLQAQDVGPGAGSNSGGISSRHASRLWLKSCAARWPSGNGRQTSAVRVEERIFARIDGSYVPGSISRLLILGSGHHMLFASSSTGGRAAHAAGAAGRGSHLWAQIGRRLPHRRHCRDAGDARLLRQAQVRSVVCLAAEHHGLTEHKLLLARSCWACRITRIVCLQVPCVAALSCSGLEPVRCTVWLCAELC